MNDGNVGVSSSQLGARIVMALAVGSFAPLGAGCQERCGDDECLFTAEEWALIASLSPLPDPPVDPTNRYQLDPAAAALGHKIFFDTRYSGALKVGNVGGNGGLGNVGDAGKVACVSCHDPKRYFVDTRSNPGNTSIASGITGRNAPTMVNLPYYQWWGWAGRHDSLWQQASLAIETPTDTAADRCDFAHFMFANYREEYDAVFRDTPLPVALSTSAPDASRFPPRCKPKANADAPDGPWEAMTPEDRIAVLQVLANQGKAVTAYETQLISRNSAFDKYVAGDPAALSPAAKRGLGLFIGKAACVDCHNTPHFSDSAFYNVGVAQEGVSVPLEDTGRFADIKIYKNHPFNSGSRFNDAPHINRAANYPDPTDADKGKFRTPTLRNVAMTGPYMHDGVYETLTAVVQHYNTGGRTDGFSGAKSPRMLPLLLEASEVSDLVAFLESLTGEPLPDSLTSSPF